MGFVYLSIVVAAITATALLARAATRRGVGALALACALFVGGALLGGIVFLDDSGANMLAAMPSPGILLWAVVGGVGGAGAVLAFNAALRQGHFGYSNAIYRSSFLVPVLFGILFRNARPGGSTLAGIALILAGITLLSLQPQTAPALAARPATDSSRRNWRWLALILPAFFLSGAPRVAQAEVAAAAYSNSLYLFLSYWVGAVLLVAVCVQKKVFERAAWAWGSAAAAASYLGVYASLKALASLPPQVVFPISLTGPILLGMALSFLFLRERVTSRGWAGALFAAGGIAILAIWK